MPNILDRRATKSTIAGSAVFTVPAGSTVTVVGFHFTNVTPDLQEATAALTIDGVEYLYGDAVSVAPGGGYEFIEPGSKLVAKAGDVITAKSGVDDAFHVILSYLEQS